MCFFSVIVSSSFLISFLPLSLLYRKPETISVHCFYLHIAAKEYGNWVSKGFACHVLGFEKAVVELGKIITLDLLIKDGAFKVMMFFKKRLMGCLIFALFP